MLDRLRGGSPDESVTLEGMTRGEFLKVAGATGLLVTCSGSVFAVLNRTADAQTAIGNYGPPFEEPVIWVGSGDNQFPVRHPQHEPKCIRRDVGDGRGPRLWCKPAAGSIGLLPDGRLIYWNALEGTENSAAFINDADNALDNDDSRVLTVFPRPSWLKPRNQEGGVNNDQASELLPGLITSDRTQNNGTMFCAHQTHLPDGTVLVVGGTHYYTEPATVELEGLEHCRIFDPKLNRWFLTGSMHVGRWYPACVPLETGDVFVCSGVHKLEKPIYGVNGQHPGEPSFANSFDNNRQTETFDIHTGKWSDNGTSGQRSLPLMPRIHLLPNGHVVYNGAGQAFSPNGQSFLQATWNIVATYNPKTKSWQDVGFAGFPFTLNKTSLDAIAGELGGTAGTPPGTTINNVADLVTGLATPGALNGATVPDPTGASNAAGVGSRLSTFEVPLLMKPDNSGKYDTLELLTGGGTISGVFFTNPGSYLATNLSRIDTLKTNGDQVTYQSRFTGTMNKRRWFSSGTLLPTGEVFACSGGDRDEVIFPGAEQPVPTAEMFDPKTETWKLDDTSDIPRTYHNTAILLPDATVLVGGHAPIPTGYLSHTHVSGGGLLGPNDGREPRFEIYSPPYLQGNSKNRPCIDDPAANWESSGGSSGGSDDEENNGGGEHNNGHKKHGRQGDKGQGQGRGGQDEGQDNEGQDDEGQGHGNGGQNGEGQGNGNGGGTKAPKAREIMLGESFTIKTCNDGKIDSVVLMRVSSVTHVNDTEQRGVKLLFTQKGKRLTAQMPSQAAVVPPGYWLLFIVKDGVPSVGMLVKVPLQK